MVGIARVGATTGAIGIGVTAFPTEIHILVGATAGTIGVVPMGVGAGQGGVTRSQARPQPLFAREWAHLTPREINEAENARDLPKPGRLYGLGGRLNSGGAQQ